MTDSIYWDAHHEADSEYRGAAVSSDSDVALLAYRGAAKRKGMLFWQGSRSRVLPRSWVFT